MTDFADAVLFEFSSARQQDFALRCQIRQWQPQLRAFFLIRTALLKYRFRLPGFDLPEPVELAQEEFDPELAKVLDGMADRMQGKSSEGTKDFTGSVEHLDRRIRTCSSGKSQEMVAAQFGAFLSLSRRIESLTIFLDKQIAGRLGLMAV